MIFLDNASTTSLHPKAIEALVEYSTNKFYNPSANYRVGRENNKDITLTKKLICQNLNVDFKNNIIFTGSATEASNLAICGSVRKSFNKLLFSVGEHPSVYNTAMYLKMQGYDVEFIKLQKNGEIDYEDLKNKLSEDVNFISIMQVNNETGAHNDLQKIAELRVKYSPNAILHFDGVQAFGKFAVDLTKLNADFYTLSAHKLHGPKGLGALYVKNPEKLQPQVWGGGQEYGIRSGTENIASIMAFKTVLELLDTTNKTFEKVKYLKNKFIEVLKENINPQIVYKYVDNLNSSPYILSVTFPQIKGETILNMCDAKGVCISTGSACSSKKSGNRILEAMGYTKNEIEGSIRVSFSNFTTEQEVIDGAKIIAEVVNELYVKTR